MNPFSSIEIVESIGVPPLYAYVQTRFPRSKRKRIRKKWAARPSNFRLTTRINAVLVGNRLIVSPGGLEVVRRQIAAGGPIADAVWRAAAPIDFTVTLSTEGT